MNTPSPDTNGEITIKFSGQFTINRSTLEELLRGGTIQSPANPKPSASEEGKPPRLT